MEGEVNLNILFILIKYIFLDKYKMLKIWIKLLIFIYMLILF